MARIKPTSERVAAAASKILQNPTASKHVKAAAASALTMAPTTASEIQPTSNTAATAAAKILRDPKSSKRAKVVAGAALTMATPNPKYIGRRKPYTTRGITRIPCVRCGEPSEYQWQCCANGNRWLGLCEACDIALNNLVLKFFKFPNRRELMRRYRASAGVADG